MGIAFVGGGDPPNSPHPDVGGSPPNGADETSGIPKTCPGIGALPVVVLAGVTSGGGTCTSGNFAATGGGCGKALMVAPSTAVDADDDAGGQ